MRIIVLAAAFVLFSDLSPAAEPDPATQVLVHDTFDEWSWEPITFAMRKAGRKRLQAGKRLQFEYRGPLYRVAKGFLLPSGRMVEGKQAFRGRSVLLEECQIGLHGRYSGLVRAGSKYRYQVSLKGRGTFHFRAWVGGTDPETGAFRWLGFPDLIKLDVTEKWKTHTGQFQLPDFDTTTFKLPEKTSAAIVIQEGHQVLVDEFSVSLVKPR